MKRSKLGNNFILRPSSMWATITSSKRAWKEKPGSCQKKWALQAEGRKAVVCLDERCLDEFSPTGLVWVSYWEQKDKGNLKLRSVLFCICASTFGHLIREWLEEKRLPGRQLVRVSRGFPKQFNRLMLRLCCERAFARILLRAAQSCFLLFISVFWEKSQFLWSEDWFLFIYFDQKPTRTAELEL